MIRRTLIQTRGLAGWLAAGVCLSVTALTWFGYRAVREWQESSIQLLDRRAAAAANLLVTALNRDMQGVQQSVLLPASWDEYTRDLPYELQTATASTFARYPYPESFFLWREGQAPEDVLFLTRSNRPPPWIFSPLELPRFPVSIVNHASVARIITARLQPDITHGRRFSIFQSRIAGVEYQIVARLFYADQFRESARGALGFTVNMPWVRHNYFQELTRQVSRVAESPSQVSMTILDEDRHLVAVTNRIDGESPAVQQRPFTLSFFDPQLVAFRRPADLPTYQWTAEVRASPDALLALGIRGANRALLIAAMAAASLTLGFVLAARAVRASAGLAELRSEFVSTVTHELKAPIATIRALGDTLASGRVAGAAAQREYASLVVQEGKRLTRLVDNLLAFSRVTDVTDVYSFERLSLDDIVDRVLQGFSQQLEEAAFTVQVDVPPHLPVVWGDCTAIELMLDNILNNAVRYSGDAPSLSVHAKHDGQSVTIEISDKGRGIAADDIPHVTRKFFRGRHASPGGSGLGLAIVKRIVEDHGGRLVIRSAVNVGTTVSITLPVADQRNADEAHTDS